VTSAFGGQRSIQLSYGCRHASICRRRDARNRARPGVGGDGRTRTAVGGLRYSLILHDLPDCSGELTAKALRSSGPSPKGRRAGPSHSRSDSEEHGMEARRRGVRPSAPWARDARAPGSLVAACFGKKTRRCRSDRYRGFNRKADARSRRRIGHAERRWLPEAHPRRLTASRPRVTTLQATAG
jgi:hypothetical protein